MLSHFDHRFSTYRGATQAQLNVGSLPRLSDAEHDDPDLEPLARYWVDRIEVAARLQDRWDRDWLLGWRDIAQGRADRVPLSRLCCQRRQSGHVSSCIPSGSDGRLHACTPSGQAWRSIMSRGRS